MKLKFSNFHYFLAGIAVTILVFMVFKKTSEEFQTSTPNPCFAKTVKFVVNNIPKNPNDRVVNMFSGLNANKAAADILNKQYGTDVSKMTKNDMTVEKLQAFIKSLPDDKLVGLFRDGITGEYLRDYLRKFIIHDLTNKNKIDLFMVTKNILNNNKTSTAGTDLLKKYSIPIDVPKGVNITDYETKVNSAIRNMPKEDLMRLCAP
jgi:hypothetical protein